MTKYITSYKELLAQCEAERAAAAEIKALPELNGSEKQIAWALDIRARKFAALNEMLASMTTTDEQLRRKNQIAIQAAKNVLASKTESRFWIDNRNTPARKLIAANNLQDELKAELARLTTEASATEVDADEYAVSTDAQDVAINAETELATAIKAHESSFWRVLATVKECRSYAEFYTGEAQWADRMVEDVDTRITEYPNDESLKEVRGEYLAEADNYRAQAQIALTQADTLETALANDSTLTAAQQSIISTATTNEQEESTMTTTTDADRILAERKTMTRRELFLEAKKEITYKLNARGAKIWYISYPQYDIRGEYIGHTPALKCTRKEVVAYLRDNYCGLTVDDFLAEQKAWIDEETTKAIIKMNIDDQAEHVSDKVACEVKPCDDNDDVFALLPELDELNDVSEPITVEEKFVNAYGKTFRVINIDGERVSFVDGEVNVISSHKYNAHFNRRTKKYVVAIVNEDGNYKAKTLDSDEEFFAEMAKRGACTIDEPEPPVDTDKPVDGFSTKLAELQTKRDAAQAALLKAQEEHEVAENSLKNFLTDTAADLTTKLQTIKFDYRIKLIKKSCWTFSTTNFDDVYIRAYRGGCGVKFHFEDWTGRTLAKYDTPAQVDKVIDMLREAIERGDTKFKFPTVDELNQPPIDTDLERKIKIEDSLRRAMEIATAEQERFLRLAATSYNKGTRKDCLREADNELKLYNICWQATNELWSERW